MWSKRSVSSMRQRSRDSRFIKITSRISSTTRILRDRQTLLCSSLITPRCSVGQDLSARHGQRKAQQGQCSILSIRFRRATP